MSLYDYAIIIKIQHKSEVIMKKPVLNLTFDTRVAGEMIELLMGDINGDGINEIIAIQGDGGFDDRHVPHEVTCITAFNTKGDVLWQVGKPAETPGTFGADYPCQVYDINGDGKCEILCVMDGVFKIIDGSGQIINQYELPDEHAHDCILIANLTGHSFARDIVLKNRYKKMWAFTHDFKPLWTHEGTVGHFPWAADINGDGYDEIMAGYDMLNHKGEILWNCGQVDEHADCIWVGHTNGETQIIIGGEYTAMYDASGKELWRYLDTVETQHICIGKFVEGKDELQLAGLDRIVRSGPQEGRLDGMFMLDYQGNELWKEQRKIPGWLTIVDTVTGFDRSGYDHIIAYRRGGGILPTLYNGKFEPVYSFDHEGYCYYADLTGCGTTDVLIPSDGKVYVYSSEAKDLTKPCGSVPLKQAKSQWNNTLYMGGEYWK